MELGGAAPWGVCVMGVGSEGRAGSSVELALIVLEEGWSLLMIKEEVAVPDDSVSSVKMMDCGWDEPANQSGINSFKTYSRQ